jgi:hypothetical protein
MAKRTKKNNPQPQDGSEYDPLQFHVRARDDRGHYERFQTQVTPDLDTEIKAVCNSALYEFDSPQAYGRWALRFGLEFLRAYRPAFPSHVAILKAMDIENARSETRRRFLETIDNTAREAYEMVGMGYPVEAAKHVQNMLEYVRQLNPEDIWRAVFIEAIKKKFGHLLTMGKVASLLPEEDVQAWERWNNSTGAPDENEHEHENYN